MTDYLGWIGAGLVMAMSMGLLSLVQREVEGWIDLLPVGLLKLARLTLPKVQRNELYDEWSAELHVVLRGTQDRPLSKLWFGIRYSIGLIRSGRRIARELGGVRGTATEDSGEQVTSITQTHTLISSFTLRGRHSSKKIAIGDHVFHLSRRSHGMGYDVAQVDATLNWIKRHWERGDTRFLRLADFLPDRFFLQIGGYLQHDVHMALMVLRYAFLDTPGPATVPPDRYVPAPVSLRVPNYLTQQPRIPLQAALRADDTTGHKPTK